MSAFSILDFCLQVGDGTVGLTCLHGGTPECSGFGWTENGATLRALPEAARIHHEQHHRAPHLMDRQVTT